MADSDTNVVMMQRRTSGICLLWSPTADTASLCRALAEHANPGQDANPGRVALAIILFSPSRHHAQDIVSGLSTLCPHLPYCGCSSSGELTPEGMQEGGFVALMLPARWFSVSMLVLDQVSSLGMETVAQRTAGAREHFLASLDESHRLEQLFAMNLIDGLSYSEERVTVAIDRGLKGMPLIGASAGDDMQFTTTWQIGKGRALRNAAILTFIQCRLPYRIFSNNNFVPTEHKLVVTEADPDRRRVSEFNAEPAAVAYARAIGKHCDELDASSFASYSVIVRFGGRYYCRSIQQLNDDQSLTFFCAIDNGLVLTVARSEGMEASSRQALDTIESEIGPIDTILGFDCISRKLDARNRQSTDLINALYREKHLVGFNAYGEQQNSLHDNQTITGVAFGTPPHHENP